MRLEILIPDFRQVTAALTIIEVSVDIDACALAGNVGKICYRTLVRVM